MDTRSNMKELKDTIKTYQTRHDGYLVDIVNTEDSLEAWIYNVGCSYKYFAFGVSPNYDRKEFMELIEANLDEYIEIYKEEMGALNDWRERELLY